MQVRLCEVSLFMVGHDGSGHVWDLTIPLQKKSPTMFLMHIELRRKISSTFLYPQMKNF
jgi:hypothetical protein